MFVRIGLLILVILVIAWLYMSESRCECCVECCGEAKEGYRSCRNCGPPPDMIAGGGTNVLNPYAWPYSGTPCVDNLYIDAADRGLDTGINTTTLYSLNTPDHVVLTN